MSAHLNLVDLSRLADGELSPEELTTAQQHLQSCPACTSQALTETLMKRAVAKAGRRYPAPSDLVERLKRSASEPLPQLSAAIAKPSRGLALSGWGVAAAILLAAVMMIPNFAHNGRGALVNEVSDLHIAMLAANQPPQVISSDRHTVKPWFQGKLPFSFNLPSALPADVVLEGANLTYIENQPVAQLIYNIGRHRASVFLRQQVNGKPFSNEATERSGFHVTAFATNNLQGVAISDVDPSRLKELAKLVEQAQ